MNRRSLPGRYLPPEPKTPWWFKAAFAAWLLIAVGGLGLVGWLIIAAIGWLERQP